MEIALEEPSQITDCIFCSGKDQQIDRRPRFGQIFDGYAFKCFERIEVGIVRNVRQPDDSDSKSACPARAVIQRDTVFLIEEDAPCAPSLSAYRKAPSICQAAAV